MIAAPLAGTVERWCWDLVTGTEAEAKMAPPALPDRWEEDPPARRLKAPGRPAGWRVTDRSPRGPGKKALRDPVVRARLVHTFLHHELQAAELMAWAVLAFPATPRAFRRGLLGVLLDEVRHMAMYAAYLEEAGVRFGDEPLRDWFWERVPQVSDPASFVAVMSLGLEGGNLDHAERFARRFQAVGDEAGARMLEVVGEEEVRHVRFGIHWFREFTGGLDFDTWRAALPEPLTPTVMRGRPMNHVGRREAGLPRAFLAALEAWDSAEEGGER